MAEGNYKLISGILFLLLVVSGTTYYISDTGTKTGCRAGWQYESEGENSGEYGCTTASGTRYQTCFNVYDSANTNNYWCKIGVKVPYEPDIVLLEERAAFRDFPELIGEVNITRISRRLNDENIVIEWEIDMYNRRDDIVEKLRGGFEVPKEQIDNVALIQGILALEVKREFEDLNKTFIPNPIIEYRDHPLWR